MNILGISAYFHDSAACLVRDGRIVAAAQEEAFSRRKHDPSYPARAAGWCLHQAGVGWPDIDWYAYYELPLLKLRRILASARAGGRPLRRRDPRLRRLTARHRRDVGAMFPAGRAGARVLAVEHHLAHAASAFFPSPFERAAVVTVDGVGEFTTASISAGAGHRLTPALRQSYPHSLGLFYSAVTRYCGFRVNSGEYKLMGLAPYGTPRFAPLLEERVIRIRDDGSFRLNMGYFDHLDPFTTELSSRGLAELFGRPRRAGSAEVDGFYADVAASAQAVFEKVMVGMARHARTVTGARNLCLAGGGALNCVANNRVLADAGFDEVWVQPAAGDAGGSLGAALYVWHQRLGRPRVTGGADAMHGALLGPAFDDDTIRRYLDSVGARYTTVSEDELVRRTADLLAAGKIVAWFQGRAEFGPRALGGRSILADPRPPAMREHVNIAVKNREPFRPFAPAVAAEDREKYFELPRESPYMLFTAPVKDEHSATLPAVTHVDGSARVQTVDRDAHPLLWRLIRRFADRTGVPVLLNTSLNVRGEPIVCTPEDAMRTFLRTGIDYLCLGNAILDRRHQSDVDVVVAPLDELD